jgi:hypothetical protein
VSEDDGHGRRFTLLYFHIKQEINFLETMLKSTNGRQRIDVTPSVVRGSDMHPCVTIDST